MKILHARHLVPSLILTGCILFCITGCGQKEPGAKERSASEAGKDSAGQEQNGASVTIPPEIQKTWGIQVQKVSLESASAILPTTAVIEINTDRSAKISPRVTGKAVRIVVSQGDRVRAGQSLAYLDSVEFDQIWADYRKTQGKLELARSNLEREEKLFAKRISPEKDVIKARQELGEAEADMNLAIERFRLAGVETPRLKDSGLDGKHPLVAITSPISGVIVERTVSQGEVVNPDKAIFFVADLSSVWVSIDVYEKDISRLKPGVDATIFVDAFPGKVFKGKVHRIDDVVDEKTRTVKARLIVANPDCLLKPGMFATVVMKTPKALRERLVLLPEKCVLSEDDSRYVFMRKNDRLFVRRDVVIGRTFGQTVEILQGLAEGDDVVVSGAFLLKSEIKKKELEAE